MPGYAVVAKASGDALVIWDASRVVRMIAHSKMNDAAANDLVKRDAIRVLGGALPNVNRAATTVTIRVDYAKTGDVSPVYGTPTFEGVEHYALLTASVRNLISRRQNWSQLKDTQRIPAWFIYKVTGRLPPRP